MECQPLGPYDRWLDASKERFTMALVADAAKVFARLPASGRGHPGRPDGGPYLAVPPPRLLLSSARPVFPFLPLPIPVRSCLPGPSPTLPAASPVP